MSMRIRARTGTLIVSLFAASAVTLVMSATFLYLKHREAPLELGCLTLFIGMFVLAGIGLALLAMRELLAVVRYGVWELECPDAGGAVGRPLAVRVHPARRFTPAGEVKLTLRCVASTTHRARGSGGTRTESQVLGSVESKVAPGGALDPLVGLPVTLEVPDLLPATTPSDGGGSAIVWQLVVEAPARRGGVHAVFELPIHGAGSA
jgi:hypothetical protein